MNDEVKKSAKANIESQKVTAILMGMIVAIALIFFAFEWSTETKKLDESVIVQDVLAEEEIEITRRDPTPPPPPPPPAPEAPEVIEVVETKVETTIDIRTEDDASRVQQETYVPPPPPKPKVEEVTEEIFVVVEEQPEFPGGNTAMMKFLSDNIKYPVIAQENGIQGRVITNFVVERDGSITDVQVVRGVDPSLDREAIRVVKSMPKWKAAKMTGRSVKCYFNLPISFKIQ